MALIYSIMVMAAISVAILSFPFLLVFLYLLYHDIHNRYFLKKINAPSPKTSQFLIGDVEFSDFLGWLTKVRAIYGNVVKYRFLHFPQVMVTETEEAKSILATYNFPKGTPYEQVGAFWGPTGLVTIDHGGPHARWKEQRALLNQVFKVSAIRNLQSIFDRNAQAMADRLETMVDQEIDFIHEVVRSTLDIISEVIGAKHAPDEFMESMTLMIHQLKSPLLAFPFGGSILRYVLFRKHSKIIDRFIYQAIREKMAERSNGKVNGEKTNMKEELTMLDLLVDAEDEETGQKLTADEIRDHLFTFFLAGHETTANTLSWLVYSLATNPSTEQALLDEVDPVTFPAPPETFRKLTYTHNCLNETLRLYPPAATVSRETNRPSALASHPEVKIPANTQLVVNIFGLQRDERYWDHPEKFDPTRWSSGEEPRQSYAYLPFSAGPRICIGKNFFYAEALTIAVAVFKRVRFELAPNIKDNGKMSADTGLLKPVKLRVIVRGR